MRLPLRLLLVAFAVMAAPAHAVPLLQLDIIGGHYDPATETVVAGSEDFTLVALLTPHGNPSAASLNALLAGTFYVSAAVTPGTGSGAPAGTFSFAGTSYNVTSDMTYGTPPLDAADPSQDVGDLSNHEVFPAYFRQFAFQFTGAQRALTYDTATQPGGYTPSATGGSYYVMFAVETDLGAAQALHFDLYNTLVATCGAGRGNGRGSSGAPCPADIEVGDFAPYDHDAESGHSSFLPDSPTSRVSEPTSLMLIGIGAAAAVRALRRRRTSPPANQTPQD